MQRTKTVHKNLVNIVVLEIFAGIKYCVSAYFNDVKKIVIFNIALANQNHNNQKGWF